MNFFFFFGVHISGQIRFLGDSLSLFFKILGLSWVSLVRALFSGLVSLLPLLFLLNYV